MSPWGPSGLQCSSWLVLRTSSIQCSWNFYVLTLHRLLLLNVFITHLRRWNSATIVASASAPASPTFRLDSSLLTIPKNGEQCFFHVLLAALVVSIFPSVSMKIKCFIVPNIEIALCCWLVSSLLLKNFLIVHTALNCFVNLNFINHLYWNCTVM